MGTFLRTAAAVLILVLFHYSIRPALDWRAEVDFVVIALLIAGVRMRPGAAALLGFALGLTADALVPDAFGASSMALSVIGYTASRLKAAFFADNLGLNALFFFAGKWAFDLIYLAVERELGGSGLIVQMFLWSPLSAAVTAVAGVVLLLLFKPLLEPGAT